MADSDGDSEKIADEGDEEADNAPMLITGKPGPTTYEEILVTLRFIVQQAFCCLGDGFSQTWDSIKACGIVVSTDYSGIGTAELAAGLLACAKSGSQLVGSAPFCCSLAVIAHGNHFRW
jgi:hypothetical protein